MNSSQCTLPGTLCTLARIFPFLLNYQSPKDLTSPETLKDGDEYDFIIVGAGPAGCVLANRLSENENMKVLLLEVGGEEPDFDVVPAFTPYTWNTRLNWHYLTEPDSRICRGQPCFWPAGRGLGGGSLHNHMMYNRGNKRTFDEWEEMGNYGWGFQQALQYFKKSENNLDSPSFVDAEYHGIGGPQSVGRFPYEDKNVQVLFEALQETGLPVVDINGRSQIGVTILQFLQKNGKRQSSNRAFLAPIRKNRPKLTIVTNVRAKKIIIAPETKRAEGVEYVWENNRKIKGNIFAKKEVIISCGAINSPQLLMLSGIGPTDTLESLNIPVIEDLKVGHNLQNQMGTFGVDFVLGDSQETLPSNEEVLADILEYAINKNGPLSGEGIFQVLAMKSVGSANESHIVPDFAIYFGPPRPLLLNYTLSDSFVSPFSYYNRISPFILNLKPKFRGLVTIDSRDPFKLPLINPFYFSGEEDSEIVREGYYFILNKLLKTKAINNANISLDISPKVDCEHLDFGSPMFFECLSANYSEFVNHYSGTCMMGPSSDPSAVVDPELRVHNIEDLRVVDASIIPLLVNGNTNAVTLMIAEKASDMIKNTWSL